MTVPARSSAAKYGNTHPTAGRNDPIMKIFLLADLHGNMVATEAMEKELDRIQPDDVWFLGDAVGKGPDSDLTWTGPGSIVPTGSPETGIVSCGSSRITTRSLSGRSARNGSHGWIPSPWRMSWKSAGSASAWFTDDFSIPCTLARIRMTNSGKGSVSMTGGRKPTA